MSRDIGITSLDFDGIKNSLKDYLRGQSAFKDYDFEGSGLSIILDLLAANTHYQAFYANMVANEAFLDSAVTRASVVSLAKHLGYTPRSTKASRVQVNLNFGANASLVSAARSGSLFIPRGEIFLTSIGSNALVFMPLESHRLTVENGNVVARNVTIYEGRLKTTTYVVNINNENQRYTIPSTNVDIDSIVVRVQKSVSNSAGVIDTWVRASDITNLDSESKVFFVQETTDNRYEIYFGDGVIGAALENGNLITIEYLITNGAAANGASSFTFGGNIGNVAPTITTSLDTDGNPTKSYGGSQPESVTSIRYYAPRNYQAQERAVTVDDYETLLAREYSDQADSFLVWGGEENDPPAYGRVYISLKPKNGTKLSDQEKLSIERTILGKRNLVSITPTVVNPDYVYINLDITVRYDPTKTVLGAAQMQSFVRQKVLEFEENELLRFGRSFRLSKLTAFINSSYAAFNSSTASFRVQKRVEPLLGRTLNYTVKFDNPIFHPIDGYPPIVSTSAFGHQDLNSTVIPKPTVTCYMEDDGYGVIRIYRIVGSDKITVRENAGTVDYAKGVISLSNFTPQTVLPSNTNEVNFFTKIDGDDVVARRNQIILFDRDGLNIATVAETFRTDRGESGSGFPR
jgi:hypothetical protein